MKKEKTIRTYQRKTKSGKITTVKSHTAKYDAAAEVAKKAAPKKPLKKPVGGGITGLEPNKKITTKSKTPKLKDVGPLSTGKVMRSKADIPAKLAKSYATFEDIPLKQAYDELMVASKKDYRRTVAFHKGHY